ncbi:zinc finger and BTB domain-containing protein 1 [Ascaphus truei]|uniref:zinc finger and BTB domain-containing protein 1 n=1 Tax=Ascaphus truei TaxID=8439 RepID=UPI003F59EDBF
MERSSHCSYVLQQLYNQREWGFLCDCCIAIDDVYFPAHKAVLAACSSYFKMIFINDQHLVAQLNLSNTKISADCFDLILQFMYLGKMLAAPTDFEQLKIAMSYLQLYIIPDSLEDIRDIDSFSLKCSSSASSSKMIFGVRMYDDSVDKSGEGPSSWTSEPALSINALQEKKPEDSLQIKFDEEMLDVCQKNTPSKVSNRRLYVPGRFGRSYTCDNCGFVFSCEKLLDEHVQTCTNRHTYQGKKSHIGDQNDRESPNPSKLSPSQDNGCKADSSQSTDDSSSSGSSKNSVVTLDQIKNTILETTDDKNPVIIKIEPDENSLVEMDDINIVKISDKDYFESSAIEDVKDEADETLSSSYYVEEQFNKSNVDMKCLRSQLSINPHLHGRKNTRYLHRKGNSAVADTTDTACELCGLTITEDDLSPSLKCSSSASSSHHGKMIFGVRMYDDSVAKSGEAPCSWTSEPAFSINTLQERKPEDSLKVKFHEEMLDVCKKNTPKVSNRRAHVHRRFGRSYTCDSCGFVFSCEKLLDEHVQTCTNRHSYQGKKSHISDQNDRASPNPSKLSPSQDNRCKADSSQSTDDSSSSGSSKNSVVTLDQIKNTILETTDDKNPVIIKIEPDENSLVEMDDINIVKISDKDYFESSAIEDLKEEPDETLISSYYVEEQFNKSNVDMKCLRSQLSINPHLHGRKNTRYLNRKGNSAAAADTTDTACELCGLTITEDDLSPSLKCSSSASSSHHGKMIFGVRMSDDSVAKSGEGPSSWTSEPAFSINTLQEKKPEDSLQIKFHEEMLDVCKKNAFSRVSNRRADVPGRFGRSYTCDSCGFVFSCEKFLDEHVQTCTNRHTYQGKKSHISDQNDRASPNPSKLSPSQDNGFKADSSQSTDDSSSSGSSKNSVVTLDQIKNTILETTDDKNPVIIKIEPDENSLVEMDDINIVKISDKDYFESSAIEDLKEEPDETLSSSYYVEEQFNKSNVDMKCLRSQLSINPHRNGRKNTRYLNRKGNSAIADTTDTACELCGLTITEDDLSSHYLSKHIENICACGKCGQILVKGRQLQEHAQRCGEPQEQTENDKIDEENHFGDTMVESSTVEDVVVNTWDDLNESGIQRNDSAKKQIYKHSASPFRCPNCGQRFESENLVVEHMSQCLDHEVFRNSVLYENDRDHRRKHFCNLCGKGFYQRCHLREHYTVHTKEKQFACQTCGKQFLRERQLRLHNDMHTGMARYVCSLCNQGNFRKHDHLRHMISHLAAGETICQVCFQTFPSKDLLEQHMDVHLYTCGACGAKFNLRKDMRSHYNSKHLKKA